MRETEINKIIEQALREDSSKEDITTNILIPRNSISQAVIVAKERGIVCGIPIAKKIFQKLDRRAQFRFFCKDGDVVSANTKIFSVTAKTRAILTGERTALNFLTHLCGIATTTALFVKTIYPFKTKIMDTRKTTPGLRCLEKYAVCCGGGVSHRFNLSEMILIKDNHKVACKRKMPLQEAIEYAKKRTRKTIEVEVGNLKEFQEALEAHPHIILLDNMDIKEIKRAVMFSKALSPKMRPLLEASGRVNIKNVRAVARTGVDRISIGALTHSRKSVDISLELVS